MIIIMTKIFIKGVGNYHEAVCEMPGTFHVKDYSFYQYWMYQVGAVCQPGDGIQVFPREYIVHYT